MRKYPIVIPLSEKVTAKIGFKDDRMELSVKTGIFVYPEISLSLVPEDLPKIREALSAWEAWLKKKNVERFLEGAS